MARRSTARARRGGGFRVGRTQRFPTPTRARVTRTTTQRPRPQVSQFVPAFPPAAGGFELGSPGIGQVIDITPGVPARDLQIVDRRNVLVDVRTGRVLKAVSVTSKIQKRRRPRIGGRRREDVVERLMPIILIKALAGNGL